MNKSTSMRKRERSRRDRQREKRTDKDDTRARRIDYASFEIVRRSVRGERQNHECDEQVEDEQVMRGQRDEGAQSREKNSCGIEAKTNRENTARRKRA